ncbi:hypothetical protein ATCC90586_004519 [Pythium insidiosum]|nr:hypothetical protein ATCC90586_004519 [Pythium insidiosum]
MARTPAIRPKASTATGKRAAKRKKQSSDDEDDEDYEPEVEETAASPKKARTKVAFKSAVGRGLGWTEPEDKEWLRILDKTKREGRPFEDAVTTYGKLCVKRKWAVRTEEGCRQRTKKLRQPTADYKWTTEKMQLVFDAYHCQRLSRKELAALYNAEAEQRGWPQRKEQTIVAKVYRLTEHDLKRQVQQDEEDKMEDFAYWTREEDEMVQQWLQHSRDQLVHDQQLLTTYMKKRRPEFKERSLAAIMKRIDILKKERSNRQAKCWRIQEDAIARERLKQAKSVDEVAIPLAAQLGIPLCAKGFD